MGDGTGGVAHFNVQRVCIAKVVVIDVDMIAIDGIVAIAVHSVGAVVAVVVIGIAIVGSGGVVSRPRRDGVAHSDCDYVDSKGIEEIVKYKEILM